LHGVGTSIRIEAFFWRVLEEIARRDGLTLNELITRLYDEVVEADREMGSFASFLRVCSGRYLALQLAGEIPEDRAVPIRSLDTGAILERERRRAGVLAEP
jgi:predicted DNA-binding ribbon-helix-helix protein